MLVGFVIMVIVSVVLMAVGVTYGVRMEQLRQQVATLEHERATAFSSGYQEGIETASRLMNGTVVETVGSITKLMMGEVIGKKDEEVRQPDSEQSPQPNWWEWEDTDRPPVDFGVGDSVVVPREFDDRVAMLGVGESMVPGVPLPDMTGEEFDGEG